MWSPLAGASRHHGDIAQLGEHLLCKQGVEGSNPFISTNRVASFSAMAYPGLDCVLFRTVRVISRGTPITMTTKTNVSSAPLGQAIYTGRRQAEKM